MEKRSVRQYWPCSKIIFNILTVVLLVGCCKNQQTQYSSPKINNDTELSVLPLTIDNKVLHENILDYAHHMKYQDIENTDYKNLIRLTFAMNGDTVNYAIWPIRELFYLLANENLFVVNIDSIYVVGASSQSLGVGMPPENVVKILINQYPQIGIDYKKIIDKQKQDTGKVKSIFLPHSLYDDEEWHLQFVHDSLVSKRIINKF